MTTSVITLWRENLSSLTTSMSAMRFLVEIMLILKAIKSHFKGSYDKQNLIFMVISYEIYETRRYEMITPVRTTYINNHQNDQSLDKSYYPT